MGDSTKAHAMKWKIWFFILSIAIIGNPVDAAMRYPAQLDTLRGHSVGEAAKIVGTAIDQKPSKPSLFKQARAMKMKDGKLKAWLYFGLAELLFIIGLFTIPIGIGLLVLIASFYFSTKSMTLFRPNWSEKKRRWLGVLFL
ncbi:MAG: hypothetical protein IT258_20515, partial [Saprospiraceae bacterium]|nr:hypothetical protein [Saprospiraceae bacterium]